ncbi:hypothetical protein ACH4U5_09520 [Streptomyces sp. NPDC020858]|uniref:hypothetical protein n=1 Tax=Streptomyces sp. NPDC020858 TaxID=3365097 RepID=UPI0037A0D76E
MIKNLLQRGLPALAFAALPEATAEQAAPPAKTAHQAPADAPYSSSPQGRSEPTPPRLQAYLRLLKA